jgi:ubiquinone/menaquinone biosynthesis C-methylase UbiE
MSEYAKHTTGSKNPIKRWLHNQRFSASLRLLYLEPNTRFLDYGCGDGELSLQVHRSHPDVTVVAYDPAQQLCDQAKEKLNPYPNITVQQHLSNLESFDRVACLETIEHLPEKELHELFANISSLIKEDGQCLFTFPIEHGVISLVKNCYRILTKRDKYVSVGRMIRRFLGLPVPRETAEQLSSCNYIYSHIGFDCRNMIQEIQKYFSIKETHVLPLGIITFGLGNSIAVLAKKL